jgi:hypothetical protein
MNISKTNFLDFQFCAKNLWLKLNKPELLEKFVLSDYEQHLADEGNEVEAIARNLFPGGIEIEQHGEAACLETTKFLTARIAAIFQATFITDGFLARSDVLAWDSASESWQLYEVKGTSSVHESGSGRNHLDDLAFQLSVLRRSGVSVSKCAVIHLNSEYVRAGELDIDALFTIEDVTEKVEERLAVVEALMAAAKEYLAKVDEPQGGCECIYRGRSNQCTTFSYSNPHVPAYSTHDLARIGASKKKLLWLVENKVFDIKDVPLEEIELSDTQVNQVMVHKRGAPKVDLDGIREEIAGLAFPLYFLDYETFSPAIPLFSGFGPFDKVPFQFSLHILRAPGAEPEHVEYLHMEQSDPTDAVIKLLEEHIAPQGTVVAWNKSFEMDVHRRMAKRAPAHAPLIERINSMFYDLKDVFHKQHYVHPEFRGSVSIKYVLPALVPTLQYKELTIHGGAQASEAWWAMLTAQDSDERELIARDLKEYCKLDTWAMYEIWKHLFEKVA